MGKWFRQSPGRDDPRGENQKRQRQGAAYQFYGRFAPRAGFSCRDRDGFGLGHIYATKKGRKKRPRIAGAL
jgi:hypothetical protein